MRLPLRRATFDAVIAFFVLLHVPAGRHPAAIGRIASTLQPGGRLYLSTGTGGGPGGIEEGWLGASMYFGGVDVDTTLRLVREAGLEVESAEVIEQYEDGAPHSFLWLVTRRRGGGPVRPVTPRPVLE